VFPNIQYFSYFAKKKSFAQKITFLNTIVSPLNNCLLKSRKLEILKCESLKSCVSKKTKSVFCSDYRETLPMRESFMPKIVFSRRHHCWNIMYFQMFSFPY